MDWNQEKDEASLEQLRKHHAGLHISNVHLVTFKQHLI